ncbi:MAG: arginine--tRNA ligase [Pseudomonadota bacterium]
MNLKAELEARVSAALAQIGVPGPALVRSAARPEFGDYQANGVMGAAKQAGIVPRDVAADAVAALLASEAEANPRLVASAEVAGPGFINLTLAPEVLARASAAADPVLTTTAAPLTVVIDYSSPNLAKEMHVGHLRSTIIGDALARQFEALGHRVIRQNHVGDWGTQFGMLITQLADEQAVDANVELSDLQAFYQRAKKRFDAEPEFADRSRHAVVGLQSGDPVTREQWHAFVDLSLTHIESLYARLGVTLRRDDVMAESAYNDALPGVIESLREQGLLEESDGAQCVFLDEFKNKNGDVLPVIVQKQGGGYLYATTDLAAVLHRATLKADRVLYLVDVRQSLHFKQIFTLARKAGFAPDSMSLEHMPFGTMLGKDGKPFKTREGGVVRLEDVLEEAERRARALLRARIEDGTTQISVDDLDAVAAVIALGAVKYSDLSKNRTSDYVFDWDQMLSFEGDTAPYLQYAYSRVRSLLRRANEVAASDVPGDVAEAELKPQERALALAVLRFQETVEQATQEGYPHYLCGYLYELATRYSQFYEAVPVLKAAPADRNRRLQLCRQTGETLRLGLDLLGIGVVERM